MRVSDAAFDELCQRLDSELWEGTCQPCTDHWRRNAAGLRHGFASVGIERGLSSFDMARTYFVDFHRRHIGV